MKCRHCHQELEHVFLDLGFAPPSNAYLSQEDLLRPELYLPLKLYVCHQCFLVQTEDHTDANELFTADYAYFSSISKGWLEHAQQYAEFIKDKINLNADSFVIEIASNDGYLLKNFVKMNVPCLGIEPTHETAEAAERYNVPVLREFFGEKIAQQLLHQGKQADLIIANNVYAHVPDINDFTSGMRQILKPGGTITLEFPHLMQLITHQQFDTVYHEHFSYLSLTTVRHIFKQADLRIFDVQELATHGGSLRVYGCHHNDLRPQKSTVSKLIEIENKKGLQNIATYLGFQQIADTVKNNLLEFLITQKKAGKTVIAYGAAAKGNTILNYAGIKPDLLPIVYDAAPSKQGKYLPGSHIPIYSPNTIQEKKPDWVLILPWNIADEVKQQLDFIKNWGGQFVTAIPQISVS